MQQAPTSTIVTRKHVSKLVLYVTPAGDLAMVSGNQHLIVSPQEVQEHVNYLLGHAELFRRHIQAPITGALALAQNGVNA